MNYKGKLYGRIGNNTYFDTAYTTDDWDAMEAKIKEIEKVKRKPLSDGTLPMTESEKVEIAKMIGFSMVYRIVYASDHLCAYISPYHKPITVDNIKAILWLAERFDLREVK